MLNTFAQNQNGGVSPQFAILVSSIFIVIGGALYLQGDAAYGLFDSLMEEIRYATKL